MFFEKQPTAQRKLYKDLLSKVGCLTRLFSESDCPYLPYRAQENIFCKAFKADNLGRADCSADAKKGNIGIGLKTWMGQDDQKVAEFGKLRRTFSEFTGIELAKTIAKYRNERIRITKKQYGLSDMVYHVVRREAGLMKIIEYQFDTIDINRIVLDEGRGNDNNTYFSDGKHTYHFNASKSTLYMLFEDGEILDEIPVEILEDPYEVLLSLETKTTKIPTTITSTTAVPTKQPEVEEDDHPLQFQLRKNQLCLRLYTIRKGRKEVQQKSGLNQWNASGRPRHPDELYIPYPVADKRRMPGFFPPRDTPFDLQLPDGQIISAKVCQDNDKAIMSNPNKELGRWLLRDVFELKEKTLVTYEMLELFGVDSVVFTKHSKSFYSVDFSDLGTYEAVYGVKDEEEID